VRDNLTERYIWAPVAHRVRSYRYGAARNKNPADLDVLKVRPAKASREHPPLTPALSPEGRGRSAVHRLSVGARLGATGAGMCRSVRLSRTGCAPTGAALLANKKTAGRDVFKARPVKASREHPPLTPALSPAGRGRSAMNRLSVGARLGATGARVHRSVGLSRIGCAPTGAARTATLLAHGSDKQKPRGSLRGVLSIRKRRAGITRRRQPSSSQPWRRTRRPRLP